jgi:hypothetical protein
LVRHSGGWRVQQLEAVERGKEEEFGIEVGGTPVLEGMCFEEVGRWSREEQS